MNQQEAMYQESHTCERCNLTHDSVMYYGDWGMLLCGECFQVKLERFYEKREEREEDR